MWKITRIDNKTHAVTLMNHKGKRIELSIPEEHRLSKEHKRNYIESAQKNHDDKATKLLILKGALLCLLSLSFLFFKLRVL